MKKRLRKKKRIGEFKEYGFSVDVRLADHLDNEAVDVFIDSFIEKAIEENMLSAGGGGQGYEFGWFIVTEKDRGSVSEEQREAVKQWIVDCPEVVEYYITPLVDSWYGDFDFTCQWVKK